jgi:multidrug efflux pump subunit AcrA (membrane-fusion protein)
MPLLRTTALLCAGLLFLTSCQGRGETAARTADSSDASDKTQQASDTDDTSSETESRSSDSAESVSARPPAEGITGGRDTVRETLVVVQALEQGSIRDEIVVSSKVEADVTVSVYPQLSGLPILELPFDEGELVEAGDLLMKLYDVELRLAEQKAKAAFSEAAKNVQRQELLLSEGGSRIRRSERSEQKMRADHQRLAGLLADGLVNLQEVEDARLDSEQAQDDLELARFARDGLEISLELSRIAKDVAEIDWKSAQEDLSHAEIRAPLSGVMASRACEVGELSSQTEAAFRLVDLSHPVLNLRVPQDSMAALVRGQSVEVRTVTGAHQEFTGIVRRVNPVLDEATGTVSVIVDLEPAPGLVPGLFCVARVITDAREQAVLIDKRAVRYEDDQPLFFALDDDGQSVRLVAFVAGAATPTSIEILSDTSAAPIEAGLQVVVVGHESLKDGSRVRVQENPY